MPRNFFVTTPPTEVANSFETMEQAEEWAKIQTKLPLAIVELKAKVIAGPSLVIPVRQTYDEPVITDLVDTFKD